MTSIKIDYTFFSSGVEKARTNATAKWCQFQKLCCCPKLVVCNLSLWNLRFLEDSVTSSACPITRSRWRGYLLLILSFFCRHNICFHFIISWPATSCNTGKIMISIFSQHWLWLWLFWFWFCFLSLTTFFLAEWQKASLDCRLAAWILVIQN